MIPIMRPLLPTADRLLPYIQRIDASRWYSNYGLLNEEYEAKLAGRYRCYVVTCSSGTAGLTAALMAVLPYNYKTRAMVGMPSWTFAATASAIFAAGFRPLICDVKEDNVLSTLSCGGCHAFVPVMPLGAPIDLAWWDKVQEEFNVRCVIDGAAAFDSLAELEIGNCPVVVSTHATKVFGTGEGGFVLSKNKDLITKIRQILNQGMRTDKSIERLGFNGKLSEYHAAVGLAELDGWQQKSELWERVQVEYGGESDYLCSTHHETLPEGLDAKKAVAFLASKGIMARTSWYGICHLQDVYMKTWFDGMASDGTIKVGMKNTEELRKRTIFLPKFVDMTDLEIEKVRLAYSECTQAYYSGQI